MNTWHNLLGSALHAHDETFNDIISTNLSEEDLKVVFDDDYGSIEGKPFLAWTKNRVYFPVVYDGAEWACSVPRNPDISEAEGFAHVGGE